MKHLPFLVRKLLLFISLFLSTVAFTQEPCNDEILMNTSGSWKKKNDANMKANHQQQVISRIDKMQQILQAAYPQPKGIDAGWYRSMDRNPLITNGPQPFQLTGVFYEYYCNTNMNKKMLGSETSTWFYVFANHLNWFADPVQNFTIQQQPVFLLTPKEGEFKGYPVYKGIFNQSSNTGIKYSKALLLTKKDQPLFIAVTKKEYLEGLLNYNEKDLSKAIADIEKFSPVEMKTKWTADTKKKYATEMKTMQDFLNRMKTDELNQPAVVKGLNFSSFKGFSTGAQGGQELVKLNPGYFDLKLPKYVPQFLIVYWRWGKSAASTDFVTQLEHNLDLATLANLIGK